MGAWELHDGAQQVGPLDEEHVRRMIAAGLPEATLVREAGSADWKGLRAYPVWAMALESRRVASVGPVAFAAGSVPFTATPMPPAGAAPYRWAIPVGVGVALFAVAVALVASASGKAPPAAPALAPIHEEPRRPVVVAPPKLTPVQQVAAAKSLPEAIAAALPFMTDTPDKSSTGTALLALWSIGHLTWKDVAVVRDETNYAKARKDIDAERGKRLCVTGSIVQIEVSKTDMGTVFEGLLITDALNIYRFTAVRSTGDIVKDSGARFCGVLTGLYDYSNSAGGTGHAVDMVGMFDLPENRKAAP